MRTFRTPLLVILLALTHGLPAAPSRRPTFQVQQRLSVPADVGIAYDVRWKDDRTLLLAAGKAGVMELSLASPRNTRVAIRGGGIPRAKGTAIPSFFFSSLLARSEQHLVAGSWFRAFAWQPAGAQQLFDVPFANILDLDARGDELVILGVRGDEKGRWGAVGATLWRAKLTRDRAHFDALPGPDVAPLRACMVLGMGAVRWLPNGNFVLAPGVEPGIRLHDPRGRLIRTWPTDRLGYEDRCRLTYEQSGPMADLEPRRDWQNRRQLLDELIVLPEGPLLIIRQPVAKGTRWRGILLPYSGQPIDVPIPVSSASPHAHVKADVRGGNVVFVIWDALLPTERPVDEPRIVVTRVVR